MSKMITRVVAQSVTVVRDGSRVTPPIGKAFDFTPAEIDYLDSVSPRASRKPTNESAAAPAPEPVAVEEEEDEDEGEPEATKATKAKKFNKPSEDDDI